MKTIMSEGQPKMKWQDRVSLVLSVLLILSLLALIGLLIASMVIIPKSMNQYFDFANDTRIKIATSEYDVISAADILAVVPLLEDKEVDDIIKPIYEKFGAVSIRRDGRVWSMGYIDPLEVTV